MTNSDLQEMMDSTSQSLARMSKARNTVASIDDLQVS